MVVKTCVQWGLKNLDMSMTMAGNSRGSFSYVLSNFQVNLIQEAFGDA